MNPARACLSIALVLYTFAGSATAQPAATTDPLPSWNDTDTRQAIVAFVEKVTAEGAPGFVPPDERIATFDNDGTLWCEQPMYVQLVYTIDRIKVLAPQHPEWKTTQPFASLLKGDIKGVAASGKKGLMALLAATHTGMTVEEFDQSVTEWISTARHPQTGKLYTEMVYQPMLELLGYLRANGFKTFIVSGGGIEFMRPWTQRVYGIPPEQVVGSSGQLKFELQDGVPVLVKLPEINLIDDKDGKPVGIQRHIGRRPLFAAGNSDGDLEMLQYTTIPRSKEDTTPRLGIIIHHTDAVREYAYDRDSLIGRLDVALNQAPERGWVVVDMKNDWKQIWPDAASQAGGAASINGEWRVEDIGGKGVVDNAHSTLHIAPDGSVTGSGGVNRYNGQATIDGKSLTVGPLASTRRAGPPALMDQETRFFKALSQVQQYSIDSAGVLTLADKNGHVIIRATRTQARK